MRAGTQPHSRARTRPRRENTPNGMLAIKAPPERTSPPCPPPPHPSKRFSSKCLVHCSTHTCHRHLHLPHILLWFWYPPTPSPPPAFARHGNIDPGESLDCSRIIHAPVAGRQCARVEQNVLEKRKLTSSPSSTSTSCASSACGEARGTWARARRSRYQSISRCMGPVSKPVLVWLAAVWLVEIESVALAVEELWR